MFVFVCHVLLRCFLADVVIAVRFEPLESAIFSVNALSSLPRRFVYLNVIWWPSLDFCC